jgi:hypothetical protein
LKPNIPKTKKISKIPQRGTFLSFCSCIGNFTCNTKYISNAPHVHYRILKYFCKTYSDLVSTDLCHRVAIATPFNMLMLLWCTRHTTYFKLLVPARHSAFFSLLGLAISSTKLEAILFSWRYFQSPVSIRIGGRLLAQSVNFKYLGVFLIPDLNEELRLVTFKKDVCKDGIGAFCAPYWNITRSATLEWPGFICYAWIGFSIEE